MRSRTVIMCITATMLVVTLASIVTIAEDDFNPPMPPSLPSGSSGSGSSGGGGGGSYTPVAFEPYTINLTMSDGTVIGTIAVKDYSLATVQGSRNLSRGNNSFNVGLLTDLSSAPSSICLDILAVDTANVSTPLDAGKFSPILAFNITRYGSWAMNSGTAHLTLAVPASLLTGIDQGSQYHLVKDDGACLIIYSATPASSDGKVLFDIPLTYEAGSPSVGIFTLAGTKARAAANLSDVTPSPESATPTPKATSGSYASILALIAALAIAAVFYSRNRKQ